MVKDRLDIFFEYFFFRLVYLFLLYIFYIILGSYYNKVWNVGFFFFKYNIEKE